MNVSKAVLEAIEKLQEAKKSNDKLQSQFASGSPQWLACENTDNLLFEALLLLGCD